MRTTRWLAALVVVTTACFQGQAESRRVPKSTLVIGIDVSGSFREHYDDAIAFTSHYLYGHLNGLGDLRVPTAVFVGSVGGGAPGEAKSFQPVHLFEDKDVAEIDSILRELYPPQDSYTDFNSFFDRVATLVKRQGLVLAPINMVMLSDGVPDVTNGNVTAEDRFEQIDMSPLEYLSRNVTVRLLYADPTTSVDWERRIKRRRVRLWTVDAPVMAGWRNELAPGALPDDQDGLWRWVQDNIDFRVRSRRL